MLRRKLLLILGSVVAIWVIAAVVAILMLQSVLGDLDHVSGTALTGSAETMRLVATIDSIEVALMRPGVRGGAEAERLRQRTRSLSGHVLQLVRSGVLGVASPGDLERVDLLVADSVREVEAFSSIADSDRAETARQEVMASLSRLREEIAGLSRLAHEHVQSEQASVTRKFRTTALVLGVMFLLLINGSILMLLRVGTIILRPVGLLVEATRRLAAEDFDARVEITGNDEFGELAASYNAMARSLRSNEERKIETLRQVARTLNHELNNAISIIEMQLVVMERSTRHTEAQEEPLRQIHQTLRRIKETVSNLARVRRIVLTDYVSGVKMLDLRRSVEDEPGERELVDRPSVRTKI